MPLIGYRRRHFKALKQIAEKTKLETARTLNAQTSASLYCLPFDLVCCICQYLPVAETFCLLICGARFWHARTIIPAFKKVQQRLHATTRNDWGLVETKFHIQRLMEFDKFWGRGIKRFCCWACMRTHCKYWFVDRGTRPVNLKFSIEEQRFNGSAAITRSCTGKSRKIWVGICYQMIWAELRVLVLGLRHCGRKDQSPVLIGAGGCFSEHVEYDLSSDHLSSRFYLGRASDLDLGRFDELCYNANIPICPHKRTTVLANAFLRSMSPGDVRICQECQTEYYVTITSQKMIELHISHYMGELDRWYCPLWLHVSYILVNSAFVDHCRAFSNWLKSMYHPLTGAVYNGRPFEMFEPAQEQYKFRGVLHA